MEMENSNEQTVLVTGGSGFIGSFCVLQLLQQGYNVRTTVRNLNREAEVRAMMKVGGVDPGDKLSFFEADLLKDDNWSEAMKNVDYVLHVASPFPMYQPKDENELIIPAQEGTLRVLRFAHDCNVKRVVQTSSFAAIGYGHESTQEPFTEETWSNLDGNLKPYPKSKTLAEKSAWEFVEKEGNGLELSVVNPVGVVGPLLGKDLSTSIAMLKLLLDGKMAKAPKLMFNFVDVRDVADLHIKAMKDPKAKGERFLATSGDSLSVLEIATILKKNLGEQANKVPTSELPNWLGKLLGLFIPTLKSVRSDLGVKRSASGEKAKHILGWNPRSNEEAIVATAKSLLEMNLVEN